MKAGIIYNTDKERAIEFAATLKEELIKRGIEVVVEDRVWDMNFIIVLGGDGTLLKASKSLVDIEIPVIAVNMGSLGFMTEIKESEAIFVIESVIEGKFLTEQRNFLEIDINGKKHYGLNEVVVAKGSFPARMVRIKVYANDEYVNTYRADGVIISSPTGSTAYNMSAGGPIIKPGLNAMVVTPISPHTLTTRPIVLPGSDIIKLEINSNEEGLYVMVDGQENIVVSNFDEISVTLSDKCISLVKPESRGYYSVLREKLKWGDDIIC